MFKRIRQRLDLAFLTRAYIQDPRKAEEFKELFGISLNGRTSGDYQVVALTVLDGADLSAVVAKGLSQEAADRLAAEKNRTARPGVVYMVSHV